MENGVKKQITLRLNEKLLERIKDIVYYNYGYTLSDFIEKTLEQALSGRYENTPSRPHKKLKPGRKIEPAVIDEMDPKYHLLVMMNDLLEDGQMTQEQYDLTYKRHFIEKEKDS